MCEFVALKRGRGRRAAKSLEFRAFFTFSTFFLQFFRICGMMPFGSSAAGRRRLNEAIWKTSMVPAPKRRLTARGRVLRRGRIFARLREGWAYDEIAEDEGVTAERIRQIVREALATRLLDEETDHAKLQLARLQPAMRSPAKRSPTATSARSTRSSKFSTDSTATSGPPRSTRSMTTRRARSSSTSSTAPPPISATTESIAGGRAAEAQGQDSGETAGPEEEKEKTPWGVGASL